jgi:hypothetical protein
MEALLAEGDQVEGRWSRMSWFAGSLFLAISINLRYGKALLMKSTLIVLIVLSFLAIDALMFHDVLKPGEHYTPVEYMTGIVSMVTILFLSTELAESVRSARRQ